MYGKGQSFKICIATEVNDCRLWAMCEDEFAGISLDVAKVGDVRTCTSGSTSVTQMLTKMTTKDELPLKFNGERKVRERSSTIARGHRMFKNIETVLSNAQLGRKSFEQGKNGKCKRPDNRKSDLASPPSLEAVPCDVTVAELNELFDRVDANQRTANEELS